MNAPWSLEPEEIAREARTDLNSGLTSAEAAERFARYGENQIAQQRKRTPLGLFLNQFLDLMIGLLVVAAVISGLIGEWVDAALIVLIVLANAVIGFVQEWRAENAVEALKQLSQPRARVRRNGRGEQVPAANIVLGDLIELNAGDIVPADARIVRAAELEADESALTGESLPVSKGAERVSAETSLADRHSMLHSGTGIVRGNALAVVTATGMNTELGAIATMLELAESGQTPLQRRLAHLSRWLATVVVGIAIVIFAAGILREPKSKWNEQLFGTMLLTAVSLAVAAIPEGLPAVISVTLALGSNRMAKRNAIVRRLAAVETLGSVDVICSDKTGTLTQNRMTVEQILPAGVPDRTFLPDVQNAAESADPPEVSELLTSAVLCSDAEISADGKVVGSATERALIEAAQKHGIDVRSLRKTFARLDEVPFSSERKRMTTLQQTPNGTRIIYIKGASDRILSRCRVLDGIDPAEWAARADELAESGRRVLAFAKRDWGADEIPDDPDTVERDLTFLGLVAIMDPVRPEAKEAIARCRSAGIRPVMITGDHPGTARSIARQLDLLRDGEEVVIGTQLQEDVSEHLETHAPNIAVYARVTPHHKLQIVRALQSRDHTVAMTGDGVNDAPALKQAEIGVAMGINGTDVSREAAEMVLADDNFATIVAAVEEGRIVFDNIQKFVVYLLTANTGEVLVLLFAILLGLPLPLLPVQILWINLVTDGLPAIALGFEPAEPTVMQRPPRRRDAGLLSRNNVFNILGIGLLMALVCVGLFFVLLEQHALNGSVRTADLVHARTMVFVVLSQAQLFYVLSARSFTTPAFRIRLWSNHRLFGAVAVGAALQVAVVTIPGLNRLFHAAALSLEDWMKVIALAAIPFAAVELVKLVQSVRSPSS